MNEKIFTSGSAETPWFNLGKEKKTRRKFKQKFFNSLPYFYTHKLVSMRCCMALKNGLFLTLVLNNYLAENSYEEVRYFVMSIIFAEKENCFGLKNNFKINIRKLQKHKGSKCHVLANFNKCTSDISLFLTNLKGDMYIVNYVWCPVELFTPYLVVGCKEWFFTWLY